ncbi:GtrA family protein [Desulfitobacterium dichloroeliminans]|uniref:GtrA family protein n=1 Tax=Desulfitobacterium dichloroeliminans TaxID=233055 RepID=UPI00059D6225|nr:GtrA family protein [Desulfitobacterium dichloroeliminans]
MSNKSSLHNYKRYLLVGGFVGLVTVALRHGINRLLLDRPSDYLLSIALAYACGILLSFLLNRTFTFKSTGKEGSWRKFPPFIIVALIGAVSTSLLSIAVRYGLKFDWIFGEFGATLAFALATFASSVITYSLNSRFVFFRM